MKKVALGISLVGLSGILATICIFSMVVCAKYQVDLLIYYYYCTAIKFGIWSIMSFAFGARNLIKYKGGD